MPLLGGFGVGGGSPQVQVALEETGSTPPPGQPTGGRAELEPGHGWSSAHSGAAASSGVDTARFFCVPQKCLLICRQGDRGRHT